MRKIVLFAGVCLLFFGSNLLEAKAVYEADYVKSKHAEKTYSYLDKETIVITGKETLSSIASEISDPNIFSYKDKTAICKANIVIKGDAVLTLKGETLKMNSLDRRPVTYRHHTQFGIFVERRGSLLIKEKSIVTSLDKKNHYEFFVENGSLKIINSRIEYLHYLSVLRSKRIKIINSQIVEASLSGSADTVNFRWCIPILENSKLGRFSTQFYDYTIKNCCFKVIRISSGSDIVLENCSFEKASYGNTVGSLTIRYYMSVRAVDKDNRPVQGALVEVIDEESGEVVAKAQTDKDGYTPLPSSGESLIITDYKQERESKEMEKTTYTYKIKINKEGIGKGEKTGIKAGISWYQEKPDEAKNNAQIIVLSR